MIESEFVKAMMETEMRLMAELNECLKDNLRKTTSTVDDGIYFREEFTYES